MKSICLLFATVILFGSMRGYCQSRGDSLQTIYNNQAGKIVSIPIIGYHFIGNSTSYDTSIELFDREMKYLHDNGFKVLTLTDLGYNDKEHYFYIK